MQNPINFAPFTLFMQQVKSAELSRSKEVKMSMEQARLLSITLSETMIAINQNYESLLADLKKSNSSQDITVEIDGGGFDP